MKKNIDYSVETLRGIAIFLVVVGHVIGFDCGFGMEVGPHSPYRYLYFTLQFLRIPLFTAISGFVYARRPVVLDHASRFVLGKARRLLIPLITGVIIKYALNFFVQRYDQIPFEQIWRLFLFPFGHLWYLQALFLVFLFIILPEHLKLLSTFRSWLVCLIITFIFAYISQGFPDFFSFDNFPYLLFFFILGIGIYRFSNTLFYGRRIIPLIIILVAAIVLQQCVWFFSWPISTHYKGMLGLWTGASAILVLFRYRKHIPLLARLGFFSYGIYLYHLFGTTGSRLVLNAFGIDNVHVIFITGALVGLFVPIGMESVIDKFKWARFIFLGKR